MKITEECDEEAKDQSKCKVRIRVAKPPWMKEKEKKLKEDYTVFR